MLPAMAFLLLFLAYPLVLGIYMSFTDVRIGRSGQFIGLENYAWMWDDPVFWLSVFNTMLYTTVASIFKFAIGLYLALLLNKHMPFKAIIRAIVLIPFIVPTVLSAIAFWWIYDPQFSIVSWSLKQFGLIETNIDFLGDTWNARWSVIFANVWRGIPFIAITLLAGLQTDGFISLSADASRLLFVQDLSPSNLWLIDLKGSPSKWSIKTKQLTSGTARVLSPSVSPDGRLVAFAVSSREEQHIFTMPIEGGDRQQLTRSHQLNDSPAWSPSGKQIAFLAHDGKAYRVALINANGGVQRTFSGSRSAGHLVWSPGERILYQQAGNRNYRILDPKTGQEMPLVPNDSLGRMFDAQYSPNGQKVAVDWNRFTLDASRKWVNAAGLWIISFVDFSQSLLARGRFFYLFGWSADGEWIYARGKGKPVVYRIQAASGEIDTFATLPFDNLLSVAMTRDGKRFICAVGERQADIWLVENFDLDPQ